MTLDRKVQITALVDAALQRSIDLLMVIPTTSFLPQTNLKPSEAGSNLEGRIIPSVDAVPLAVRHDLMVLF